MTAPPQPLEIRCTHERRPGTTVCLLCRRAARVATLAKRKQLLVRTGAMVAAAAAVIAAGTFGAAAIRSRSQQGVAARPQPASSMVLADASGPIDASVGSLAESTSEPPPVVQEGTSRPAAPISPVIPVGQSTIASGVTALRGDSTVTLSFDSPMTRTRIPEKFERFVRATLPVIYGHDLDSVLARLPIGGISSQGGLTSELPTRGVRIPIGSDWMLRLFPETRAGQDGPLVVRYRVAVVPAGE